MDYCHQFSPRFTSYSDAFDGCSGETVFRCRSKMNIGGGLDPLRIRPGLILESFNKIYDRRDRRIFVVQIEAALTP